MGGRGGASAAGERRRAVLEPLRILQRPLPVEGSTLTEGGLLLGSRQKGLEKQGSGVVPHAHACVERV